MSDTPISDRAEVLTNEVARHELCEEFGAVVDAKVSRQLERMAGELAEAICEGTLSRQRSAIDRWQEMKEGK